MRDSIQSQNLIEIERDTLINLNSEEFRANYRHLNRTLISSTIASPDWRIRPSENRLEIEFSDHYDLN
jgi:hypothetical protein